MLNINKLTYPSLHLCVENPTKDICVKYKKLKHLIDNELFNRISNDAPVIKLDIDHKTTLTTSRGEMYIVINSLDSDYNDFNTLSSYFTDFNRAISFRQNMASPYDYWRDNKHLVLSSTKNRLQKKGVMFNKLPLYKQYYELRESIYIFYGKRYECTSHRPLIPAVIYKYFNAKDVLDMSSGWGDRAIAAAACGCNYVGIDPNPSLVEQYNLLKKHIGGNLTFICCCAEDYVNENAFDLMYTSPPYWVLENYEHTNNSNQSTIKYPFYNLWITNFLYKMLDNSVKSVRNGGHILINIVDYSEFKFINTVIEYLLSINQIFLGFMWYIGNRYNNVGSPIIVFRVNKKN